MSIYRGWRLHHWLRRMIWTGLFFHGPEHQSNIMTFMKSWVIMRTMRIIIRFGDHDDHYDDCNHDDVEIPLCPPSHQGESSPAYSCRACNKKPFNCDQNSTKLKNIFVLYSDFWISCESLFSSLISFPFVCVNARSILSLPTVLCQTVVASTLALTNLSWLQAS